MIFKVPSKPNHSLSLFSKKKKKLPKHSQYLRYLHMLTHVFPSDWGPSLDPASSSATLAVCVLASLKLR